ncbi:MAG: hypothetical protein ACI9ND_000350 [Yoonia sp.]|jgi:hypothetical protein
MNTDIYGETSHDVSDAIVISVSGPAKCASLFRDEEFLGEIDLTYLCFVGHALINGIPSQQFPQNPETDFEGAVHFIGQRKARDDEFAVEHT